MVERQQAEDPKAQPSPAAPAAASPPPASPPTAITRDDLSKAKIASLRGEFHHLESLPGKAVWIREFDAVELLEFSREMGVSQVETTGTAEEIAAGTGKIQAKVDPTKIDPNVYPRWVQRGLCSGPDLAPMYREDEIANVRRDLRPEVIKEIFVAIATLSTATAEARQKLAGESEAT